MSSSSIRKHAGTSGASDQPSVPEPSFAERARTLVHISRIGSLSTLSRKQPGFPFGSVMPYGLDERGRPIFLVSTMAMHTQNLKADPRASLLVTQDDTDGDPLGASSHASRKCSTATGVGGGRGSQALLSTFCQQQVLVDFEDVFFYPWTWWTFTTWATSD
jgi:Pyridoxamine 5'-phosphate oxidase